MNSAQVFQNQNLNLVFLMDSFRSKMFLITFCSRRIKSFVNSAIHECEFCSIKRVDVFLTCNSETLEELGLSCVALRDYEDATFNGFTKRLRPKADAKFVPE